MIGKLSGYVLETRDPRSLAEFYQKLLGGSISADSDEWVVLTGEAGPTLGFQLSAGHVAPEWPGSTGEQQAHLDIEVDDLEDAHAQVLEAGATLAEENDGWRVYLDPSGHPFCTVA